MEKSMWQRFTRILGILMFEFPGPLLAKPKRNNAGDTKRRINATPPKGNSSERAKKHCVRNNEGTSNHAKGEEPSVAHRVTNSANKCYRDNKVSECEPIRPVKEEGMAGLD